MLDIRKKEKIIEEQGREQVSSHSVGLIDLEVLSKMLEGAAPIFEMANKIEEEKGEGKSQSTKLEHSEEDGV